MKHYLFFVLFFCGFSISCYTQDTLREQNSVMYGKYYVLHENNKFEFFFNHCTGLTYGQGKIKKGLFRWKFKFDELLAQSNASSYSCSNSEISDSVKFIFRTIIDSNFQSPYSIVINGKKHFTFNTELTLSNKELSSDSIEIIVDGEVLVFNEDISVCNEVTLYLRDLFKTYVNGGKEILKKRNNSFYLTSIVRIKDEENYWKKGKRRKYMYEYKVI